MIQENLQVIAEFKDAASAGLTRLSDALKQLNTATKQIQTDFDEAVKSINQIGGAAQATEQKLSDATSKMKMHAGASREVLVLMHEALTGASMSRIGGSLMVLGEQFNALGKAVSFFATGAGAALGGTALAATAVGVAFYQAAQQAREFNNALLMTSNYAGLTSDKFKQMSQSVAGGTDSSYGKASATVLALAKSGVVAGNQMEQLGKIIINQSILSGESLEKTTEAFTKMSEGPTKFMTEYNKVHHLFTAAEQEKVQSLEATGHATQAAQVVLDAFTRQQEKNKLAIIEEKGVLGELTTEFGKFWQAVKVGIGAEKLPLAKQLEDVNDQIAKLKINGKDLNNYMTDAMGGNTGATSTELQDLIDKRSAILKKIAAMEKKSAKDAAAAQMSELAASGNAYIEQLGIKTAKGLDNALAQLKTKVQEARSVFNNTGFKSELLDSNYQRQAEEEIRKRFSNPIDDTKAKEAYRTRIEQLDSFIRDEQDAYKLRQTKIKAELDKGVIDELEAAKQLHDARMKDLEDQKAIVVLKENAAAAEAKRTNNREGVKDRQKFADDIKHIQNEELIATAEYEADLAKHAQTVTGIYEKMVLEINKADRARRASQERELNKITMSANEAGLADAQNQIRDKFAALRASTEEQLARQHASTEEVKKALDTIDDAEQKALQQEKQFYTDRLNVTNDWKTGVIKAVKDTQEAAANSAAKMQSFINDLTKSFEDGIYKFLKTGKLSFKDLETSWADSINRMVAKALAAKLQEALFGGTASGSSGLISSGLSMLSGLFGAGHADGGPVSAGTIYPVGEKGPELFVPSVGGTIIPNHQLSGSSGQSNITFNITAWDSQSVISGIDKHQRQIAEIVNNATRKYNLS